MLTVIFVMSGISVCLTTGLLTWFVDRVEH